MGFKLIYVMNIQNNITANIESIKPMLLRVIGLNTPKPARSRVNVGTLRGGPGGGGFQFF